MGACKRRSATLVVLIHGVSRDADRWWDTDCYYLSLPALRIRRGPFARRAAAALLGRQLVNVHAFKTRKEEAIAAGREKRPTHRVTLAELGVPALLPVLPSLAAWRRRR